MRNKIRQLINEIQLGDIAKDKITSYEGKVVGITDWLYQCRRLGIQATELDKDGKPHEIQWVDELQCELVAEQRRPGSENPTEKLGKDKGGPMSAPTRNQDPRG